MATNIDRQLLTDLVRKYKVELLPNPMDRSDKIESFFGRSFDSIFEYIFFGQQHLFLGEIKKIKLDAILSFFVFKKLNKQTEELDISIFYWVFSLSL